MDPETPPEVDDGSQEDLQRGQIENKEKENDPHNLEEKFYRYGVFYHHLSFIWSKTYRFKSGNKNSNQQSNDRKAWIKFIVGLFGYQYYLQTLHCRH